MVCPKCGAESAVEALECARCGVIFARLKPPAEPPRPASGATAGMETSGSGPFAAPRPAPPLPGLFTAPRPGQHTPVSSTSPAQELPVWDGISAPVAPPQFSSPPPSRDLAPTYSAPIDEDPGLSPSRWVKALVLDPPVTVSIPVLGAQALLQLGLLVWGASFVAAPVDSDRILESFMHLIHLPFHEFGHLFFSPLGTFMQFLGGTLGQLLMPLICLFTLLIRTRDPFGAAVCLWWLGQSFIDCAPYINDATRLRLVMVSGELAKDTAGHDWENILSMLGWLRYDHTLAVLSHRLGSLLIVLSWVWGISLIRLQLQRLRAGDTRRRLM